MPKTRVQKEEIVQNLSEKFSRAKSVVFADYKGLTMKQLSDLRIKLAEVQGEFTITKNTLLEKSLTDYRLPTTAEDGRRKSEVLFEGPTATLFSYDDEISPIKLLVKTLKDAALGKVKNGFLGQEALDEAKILQLATLPSKDELRAKTVHFKGWWVYCKLT
ncbi:50S ribosomal protein L10 [Candidatus Daviesbacteria bacterium]|nr:50S ribosomal protein L10 [Candidatus Daviesbacteria bacterium]